MKRTLFSLAAVLLALGLLFTGCMNPVNSSSLGSKANTISKIGESGHHQPNHDPGICDPEPDPADPEPVDPCDPGNEEPALPKLPVSVGKLYSSVTAANAGIREDILEGSNIVPNSNHFLFAALDRALLADGVDLEFYVGNDFQLVGSGSVKLDEEGCLVIAIDNCAKGEYGAVAFDTLPVINNGNIHSLKIFSHDNNLVIPCPEGDIIYLYFHAGSLQFYI